MDTTMTETKDTSFYPLAWLRQPKIEERLAYSRGMLRSALEAESNLSDLCHATSEDPWSERTNHPARANACLALDHLRMAISLLCQDAAAIAAVPEDYVPYQDKF